MTRPRGAGLAILSAAVLAGCNPDEPELVALHGCGVESDIPQLRVVVRGDFPPSGDTELLLSRGETGHFSKLPSGANALTVEGLIGTLSAAVGRTRGVEDDQMVVYFAPPDSLCSVPSGVASRDAAGIAVGGGGEVLIAGGRRFDGDPTDELVRVDLDGEETEILAATLPAPTAGQTLHAIGEHRFLMIGGARAGDPWFSTLELDLGAPGDPVGDPVPLEVAGSPRGVAYHGAKAVPDGRILVVGGCETIDEQARCATDPDDPAQVTRRSFWLDPDDPTDADGGPNLVHRRFSPNLLVGRDGVAYAVGGYDGRGDPVTSIERLARGVGEWKLIHEDLPGEVAGAALVEDGLVAVAFTDGSAMWFSEVASGLLGPELDPGPARPMHTTPGERVAVDTWLLPIGSADPNGAAAIDLVGMGAPGTRPPPRVGPTLVGLEDGSYLVAGGLALDGDFAVPFLARARPALDGPDEELPDVAEPDPDAFVSNPPGVASIEGQGLVLEGTGQIEEYPRDRVHVRGFRSRSFDFDFVVRADGGRAHVVILQGAMEGLSFRLDPDGVLVRRRGADGQVEKTSCEIGPDPMLGGSASLSLSVSPAGITLAQAGQKLAVCPGLEGVPAAVGLGVSGQGSVEVEQMRLFRR